MLPPTSKRNVRADERLARVGYVTVTVHTCVHVARVRRAAGVHVALIRAGVHVARVRRATRLLGSGRASTWHSSERASTWHSSERASTWRDRASTWRTDPSQTGPSDHLLVPRHGASTTTDAVGADARAWPPWRVPDTCTRYWGEGNGCRTRERSHCAWERAGGRQAPYTWHMHSAPEAQPARRRRRDHTPRLARARALL